MPNGFWEPGETIEILPLVKNYWGPIDGYWNYDKSEFEDTSKLPLFKMKYKLEAYRLMQLCKILKNL